MVANRHKLRGNEYFKKNQIEKAIDEWSFGIKCASLPELYANRSLAYQKMCLKIKKDKRKGAKSFYKNYGYDFLVENEENQNIADVDLLNGKIVFYD